MKIYTEKDFNPEQYDVENFPPAGSQAPSITALSLRRAYFLIKNGKLLLSVEQKRELENLIRKVRPGMNNQVIVQNLRLVVSIAMRYSNRGVALLDLIREGNQGLILAFEKKVLDIGFHFSSYVTWSICQHIENAILNQRSQMNSTHSVSGYQARTAWQ